MLNACFCLHPTVYCVCELAVGCVLFQWRLYRSSSYKKCGMTMFSCNVLFKATCIRLFPATLPLDENVGNSCCHCVISMKNIVCVREGLWWCRNSTTAVHGVARTESFPSIAVYPASGVPCRFAFLWSDSDLFLCKFSGVSSSQKVGLFAAIVGVGEAKTRGVCKEQQF